MWLHTNHIRAKDDCLMVRIMFKKILVAIDGSKTADRALDFAFDLGVKYSAEVLVVSVFDVISTSLVARGMVFSPAGTSKYLEELEVFHEKVLVDAVEKGKNFKANLKVSKRSLKGRAVDKIVETANEGAFDLIVVGSRGLGGIRGFFLGGRQ